MESRVASARPVCRRPENLFGLRDQRPLVVDRSGVLFLCYRSGAPQLVLDVRRANDFAAPGRKGGRYYGRPRRPVRRHHSDGRVQALGQDRPVYIAKFFEAHLSTPLLGLGCLDWVLGLGCLDRVAWIGLLGLGC